MKVWKQFEEHRVTHSMAHYLMAIAELLKAQGYCRVTDVARDLDITPGSASVSIKALKKRGWVDEDANRFLRLSPEGEKIATGVHANYRALISFLTEVLEVDETQADIDACKIEHLVSRETRAKLLRFLHFIHGPHSASRDFLESWHAYKGLCPGQEECRICDDICGMYAPPPNDEAAEHPHHSEPEGDGEI